MNPQRAMGVVGFVWAAGTAFGAGDDSRPLTVAIDSALDQVAATERLSTEPDCGDAAWLRRASLDLCGIIPAAAEVERFLADATPEKRDRKVDEYLASDRFSENLASLWTNLLLPSNGKQAERTNEWLEPWLTEQFSRGVPFSEIVRAIVSESGESRTPGAIAVTLNYRDSIETLSGLTARAFLGLQIECAQCHDHPFDHWKRDEFNRFTAFFADVRGDVTASRERGPPLFRVVDRNPEWDLSDRLAKLVAPPRKKKGAASSGEAMNDGPMGDDVAATVGGFNADELAMVRRLMGLCQSTDGVSPPIRALVADADRYRELLARSPVATHDALGLYHDRRELFSAPRFLDGSDYTPAEGVSKRAALANWIVAPENDWFARAIVNRVWRQLFGAGLIEPVDDLSGSKDQVAPELLARLAREFSAHGTDLRFLIGAIARTRAYARANRKSDEGGVISRAERTFAAHSVRSFSAEQIANSLNRTLGQEGATGVADPTRSYTPRDSRNRDRLLAALGTILGARDTAGAQTFSPSIPEALFLLNGPSTEPRAQAGRSEMVRAFGDVALGSVARLTPVYLATLGRPPRPEEAERLLTHALAANPPATAGTKPGASDPLIEAFDDLLWALLNSTEFHTNH